MSFQAMMSGAECSTGNNALSQFLKHTSGDRSLQQGDRTQAGPAGPSSSSMRQQGPMGPGSGPEAEAFFRQQQQQGGPQFQPGAYDFEQMKAEMNRMGGAGGPGAGAGWADEMQRRGAPGSGPQPFSPEMLRQMGVGGGGPNPGEMEAAFARGGDGQAQAWRQQFPNYQPQSSTTSGSGGGSGGASTFAPRYGMGGSMGMGYGGMSSMGGMGMYNRASPQLSQSRTQQQQQQGNGQIVELDDAKWEEQFAKLDQAGKDGETATSTDKGKGKGKAKEDDEDQLPSEAEQDRKVREALDALERDVQADGNEAQTRFEELWKSMNAGNAPDPDLANWEKELSDARNRMQDEMYMHPGGGIGFGEAARGETAGLDGTEDALLDGFGTISADGYPRLGSYRFDSRNPFVSHEDPLSEGLRLLSSGGSLADAALLFEVATQRDVAGGTGGESNEVDAQMRHKSEAWRRLGEAQAMNERETQAIRALEEAIRLDEGNLEAYMSLAIAYTNEGYDAAAHSTLERYMQRAYPHIKPAPLPASISGPKDPIEGTVSGDGTTNPWASLNRVTSLFLQAAREGNSSGRIDPEVQVGLGVLFYSNSSYDQAKDCFETALQARPNDFLLWNRLGATLANGGKPEEAIEAYHKALELRPTFTRAIYNLSVSCLNLGAHHEAAEHLLAALSLQQTHALPDVPPDVGPGDVRVPPLAEAQESSNLWSTLRRIFLCMDRMDLAQHAHVGADLSQFRAQGFEF